MISDDVSRADAQTGHEHGDWPGEPMTVIRTGLSDVPATIAEALPVSVAPPGDDLPF